MDGRSIDYSVLEVQDGDENPTPFSFLTEKLPAQEEQLTCWIGYTNDSVHEVLKKDLTEARCLTEGSSPQDRDIALVLRTRSIDLQIVTGISFFWSRRDGILMKCI